MQILSPNSIAEPKPFKRKPFIAVTPQAWEIYELLLVYGKPMSPKMIATRLDMAPQNVYRATRRLVQLGIIRGGNSMIGHAYRALPPNIAHKMLLGRIAREFEARLAAAKNKNRS